MSKKRIPLIDLSAQYEQLHTEINRVTLKGLKEANFILGEEVISFEKEMSNYLGVKHCIAVGNGTDALVLALKALNIGVGDEVITTPFTFFATAESIATVGAVPVFVDIDPVTYNLDISKIEGKITKRTKAILPVHIFGTPVKMDELMALARKYDLKVIEDACQAIGASYKGKKVGTIGDIGCFSFFPTKNLGCAGDGGMVVTNNQELATIVSALRSHGGGELGKKAYHLLHKANGLKMSNAINPPLEGDIDKYTNYLIGMNSRLDSLQAAILRIKLPYLDQWNKKRAMFSAYYNQCLEGTSFVVPRYEGQNYLPVYHLYILQSEARDEVVTYLDKKGICTGIYYSTPLHLQKAFHYLGYKKGSLPISEKMSQRTFAIPIYPELTLEQRQYIVDTLLKWEVKYGK